MCSCPRGWAGVAAKDLSYEQFHDGVARNLATMERVLNIVLHHLDDALRWPLSLEPASSNPQAAPVKDDQEKPAESPAASAPERAAKLGVIAGSSFLKSPYFSSFSKATVDTAAGRVLVYHNKQRNVFVVQRHAACPDVPYSPPHLINKKAILLAMEELQCTRVLAFGSVGSLSSDIPVGSLMVGTCAHECTHETQPRLYCDRSRPAPSRVTGISRSDIQTLWKNKPFGHCRNAGSF